MERFYGEKGSAGQRFELRLPNPIAWSMISVPGCRRATFRRSRGRGSGSVQRLVPGGVSATGNGWIPEESVNISRPLLPGSAGVDRLPAGARSVHQPREADSGTGGGVRIFRGILLTRVAGILGSSPR